MCGCASASAIGQTVLNSTTRSLFSPHPRSEKSTTQLYPYGRLRRTELIIEDDHIHVSSPSVTAASEQAGK